MIKFECLFYITELLWSLSCKNDIVAMFFLKSLLFQMFILIQQ